MAEIDAECLSLVQAINQVPAINTIESCCGHRKTAFGIWFVADSLACLPRLLYWFSACHCGFYGWKVYVTTDCAMSPVHFCAEGPIGEQAYIEAEKIADLIINAEKG